MRSKRSKAWHRRKEIRRTRELIEHGSDSAERIVLRPGFTVFVHPSIEADIRALKEK